jgi:hypothetical protein
MKKSFFSIALMMACSFVAAQTSNQKGDYRFFQPFELSVNLGETSSAISYPNSHISSGNNIGWTAGLSAQFNKEFFGIRTGVSYELSRTFFINEKDPLGSAFPYRQSTINVPLTFMYHTNGSKAFGLYGGVGANMRYSLDSSLDNLDYKTNNLQWYAHGVFGFRFAHLYIEDEFCSQFNTLFKSGPDIPKANLSTVSFKIGWVF